MKVPASLLSQLRATIAASAVLAAGCDLVGGQKAEEESAASAEAAEADGAVDARSAPEQTARVQTTPTAPVGDTAGEVRGLAGTVARAVDSGRSRPASAEDPTAFVPFETGTRVRETESAPLAFAEPAPKPSTSRPKIKRPKKIETTKIETKPWHDPCPACGRG